MVYEYILIRDGYQGRGATTLENMGKVESATVEGAISAARAHHELADDSGVVVFVRPDATQGQVMTGTVLS